VFDVPFEDCTGNLPIHIPVYVAEGRCDQPIRDAWVGRLFFLERDHRPDDPKQIVGEKRHHFEEHHKQTDHVFILHFHEIEDDVGEDGLEDGASHSLDKHRGQGIGYQRFVFAAVGRAAEHIIDDRFVSVDQHVDKCYVKADLVNLIRKGEDSIDES